MLCNMASYIRQFGTMEAPQLDRLLHEVEQAFEAGEGLIVLPQFLVTARA